MKNIKYKLGVIGLLVAVVSIISIIFSIFNYDIKLFSWMDAWGNTMGWIIRPFLILGGEALFFFYEDTNDEYLT